MSPYEILAVAALACAGGFAWHLYRKDTRDPGAVQRPANQGERMFARPGPKPGGKDRDRGAT